MNDDSFDAETFNEGDESGLAAYLDAVAQLAVRGGDFTALRQLTADSFVSFRSAQPLQDADPVLQNRLVLVLARDVWNALPLPSNHFKPQTLPEPERNAPCFCGSGDKYKHCCRLLQEDMGLVPMTPELLWPFVVAALPRQTVRHAAREGLLPIVGVLVYAEQLIDQGNDREAVRVLQRVFIPPLKEHGEDAAAAYTLLCNLYDQLDRMDKKEALNDIVITFAPRSPLRAEMYQRIATMLMDAQLPDDAWAVFKLAQQGAPGDPSLSLLEVNLLLAQNRVGEAKQRAAFWLKRIGKDRQPDTAGLREFLERVVQDPDAAMLTVGTAMDYGAADWIPAWVAIAVQRPLPKYTLDSSTMTDEQGAPITVHEFMVPQRVVAVESRWHEVFPLEKPVGIHDYSVDDEAAWGAAHEARWRRFLEEEPAAADSLSIIDDILTAFGGLKQASAPWFLRQVTQPLIERARAIIDAALGDVRNARIIWLIESNRPALRTLARSVGIDTAMGAHERAIATERRLLELNPHDNHGFRAPLINADLQQDRNSEALELAERYADDMHAEIVYGRALAYYRLEKMDLAQQALQQAIEQLPLVPKYLLAKNIREPALEPDLIKIGGDDQAWFYRLAMHTEWARTPGAMRWLEQISRTTS